MTDADSNDERESEKPLLTLENIEQSFGAVTVLTDVSLRVRANTVTAVVGPNGSGKTTLSRVVAGLSQPTTGDVSLRTDAERPVGYLPQEPQFRPVFTIEETLRFYADLLTTAEDPMSILEQVGLSDVSDRRIDALSGGMRRLVGIAQSLLGSPPVVVFDEPTSGLDPRMTRQIFDIITRQAADGTSIFLTTHDLSYATKADSLVVLHHGRVVAQEPPEELLTRTDTDSLPDAFFSLVGREPAVQTGHHELDNG